MFREMRRKKQALSEEECIDILINEPRGVLAVLGDNEYPYAVPLRKPMCTLIISWGTYTYSISFFMIERLI